jgi:hypothetical protein
MSEPFVILQARVPLATNESRKRLQQLTGLSVPKLVAEAFRVLEAQLAATTAPSDMPAAPRAMKKAG